MNFTIDATVAAKLGFASHQNAVPLLRDLTLGLAGDGPTEHLRLFLAADPPFVRSKSWVIDRLSPGDTLTVADRDVRLDAALLAGLTESVTGCVTLTLADAGGAELASVTHPTQLLAHNEWGGLGSMAELLPAFVMPNDPAVDRVLKGASDALRRAGKSGSLDGYEAKDRTRVWQLASAIWAAIAGLRLSYALPPASFERAGQKVRTPGAVLEGRVATCLDTALLFAAALEQAGLNPVVVFTRGHAFAGVWLQPVEFGALLTDEAAALRRRCDVDDLLLFETTLATNDPPATFTSAIATARRQVAEDADAPFEMAVDIRRARMQRIHPLGVAASTPAGPEVAPVAEGLEDAPALPPVDVEVDDAPITPDGRVRQWQRKLLNLTTANRLLHLPDTAKVLRLLCPDPGALEDLLAKGRKVRITPLPDLGVGGRDAALHEQRTQASLRDEVAAQALARGEALSPLPADKLSPALVDLYRKARTDMEEGGANTLFLALGFLHWKKSATEAKTYRAPLILLPVRLERKSALSGVVMTAHEDEPRFNLTLLELLRQDFELTIPALADELPTDAHGVDVAAVWRIVRAAVRDMPGFEVVPDVVLGTFSFAKYLMWKDLVDRADRLTESPLVRHLIERDAEAFGDRASFPKPHELDQTVNPAELFAPLPADSSQLAAVVASARGHSFVLDGPPGCGKSQTIANMIAHNLALGRRVLFVAEKRAALDVVQRRLAANGLGPFCLELHSAKATKAAVLKQLDAAWTTRDELTPEEWAREADAARTLRDELNAVVELLHRAEPNGWSIHRAIGLSVRDGGETAPRLAFGPDARHDVDTMVRLRESARALGLAYADIDDLPPELAVVGRADWSPGWQEEIVVAAIAIPGVLATLDDARDRLRGATSLPLPTGDRAELGRYAAFTRLLLGMHGHDLRFAFSPVMADRVAAAREALALIADYRAEEAGLSAPYAPEAARRIDLDQIQAAWAEAGTRFWFLATLAERKVARGLALAGGAAGEVDPARDLPRLRIMRDLLGRIDALAPRAADLPGWAGLATDPAAIEATIARAERVRSAIAAEADGPDALAALRTATARLVIDANDLLAPGGSIDGAAVRLEAALGAVDHAVTRFDRLADGEIGTDFAILRARAAAVAAGGKRLQGWTAWRRARADATAIGLAPLVDALETARVAPEATAATFEVAYAHWFAFTRLNEEPLLQRFAAREHGDRIDRFRALDDRIAGLTSRYVRAKLCGLIPDKGAASGKDGYAVLKHQLQLQRAHKPIRRLAADMGDAFTRLAPCMLMSPLSIAQYLPADQALFDLVIFDEASQITPWDAIGAMARGRQVVIAGDPRQMPPSNDFQRAPDASTDDGGTEPDLDSILDECLGAGVPQHSLDWHYRSRHESLIAFSNHNYYDNRLVTFPAPETRASAVGWVRVPGVWARGAERTNQIEAKAIVDEAVRRLRDPAFVNARGEPLTLGIITMNIEQMRLVENLLDAARRAHPEIEPHFSEDRLEPVVVRNLETAQGDERDVMLIGVGFGPTEPGGRAMSMNFGKLNMQGGWRRLNVAVTRARAEMKVFTSFDPGMIDLTRTNQQAVRDLKHFVEYADRGPRAIAEADHGSMGGADSPFEEAVAAELRRRGWTVVPQVGVSRFRIDLGIVHPDRPGDYLVGVECDGATYHSAATARDRDKVRQAILEGLGWRLFRLWSTEWWTDRARAADKLDAAIRAALDADRAARAATPEPVAPGPDPIVPVTDRLELAIARAAPEPTPADSARVDLFQPPAPEDGRYRLADLTEFADRIDPTRFHDPGYDDTLRLLIAHVVEREGPIAEVALVQRIARAHGFLRAGRLIGERVTRIAARLHHLCPDSFVWPGADAPAAWATARYPATVADLRAVEDIAPAELRAAGSTDPAEVARRFGVRRLSAPARARLDRVLG